MIEIIVGLIIGLICGLIIIEIKKKNKYHGPNSNEIKKKIYKFKNKYYIFKTNICPCRLI